MGVTKNRLASWFNRKIGKPLYLIVSRGTEPKQLAFSAALGFTLGIFPICGVTALLCGIAIALLGSACHAPTVLLANFIATPVELSLVIPFLRFGETLTGGSHFQLTSDALKKVFMGQASREVLLSIAHADCALIALIALMHINAHCGKGAQMHENRELDLLPTSINRIKSNISEHFH